MERQAVEVAEPSKTTSIAEVRRAVSTAEPSACGRIDVTASTVAAVDAKALARRGDVDQPARLADARHQMLGERTGLPSAAWHFSSPEKGENRTAIWKLHNRLNATLTNV